MNGLPELDEVQENFNMGIICAQQVLTHFADRLGLPEETALRVASAFGSGMLLQADPTVIYGLGPAFDGNLRRRDLDDANNLYNTYQRPGLPPGPICSFGAAALSAAVHPEAHNYLYFVAKYDGGEHVFSTNLNDHNKAVRQYLQNRRSAKPAAPDAR
jgi:conserved hypothetical protein, YceG family